MRRLYLGMVVLLCTTQAAFAQEAPYSQTLDEQMQRVQQGQPAVPLAGEVPALPPSRKAINAPVAAPAAGSVTRGPATPSERFIPEGGGAIPALPLEVQTSNGIAYITGGIGDEDMMQLRSIEKDYNVQLLMTGVGGAFLSDATVRILNAGGTEAIFSAPNAGPYLYVNLPPGKYTFEVTARQGGIKTATVNVPKTGIAKPIMTFTE